MSWHTIDKRPLLQEALQVDSLMRRLVGLICNQACLDAVNAAKRSLRCVHTVQLRFIGDFLFICHWVPSSSHAIRVRSSTLQGALTEQLVLCLSGRTALKTMLTAGRRYLIDRCADEAEDAQRVSVVSSP